MAKSWGSLTARDAGYSDAEGRRRAARRTYRAVFSSAHEQLGTLDTVSQLLGRSGFFRFDSVYNHVMSSEGPGYFSSVSDSVTVKDDGACHVIWKSVRAWTVYY